jgi:hypothetical protein
LTFVLHCRTLNDVSGVDIVWTWKLTGGAEMGERLTDRLVKSLPIPASGSKIYYDAEVKEFAARREQNLLRCRG